MERPKLELEWVRGAERRFELFHDESGFGRADRWGVHGMLAVPAYLVDPIAGSLRQIRDKYGYYSEVHLRDITGSAATRSPRFLVARDWLIAFFEHFLCELRFKAFAVDMRHDSFDRKRYPTRLAAYRRFFVTDGKALVAWCLRGEGVLLIRPFTDAGSSYASKVRRRDRTLFDSFATYLIRECKREREKNRKLFYPEEVVVDKLRAIVSTPSRLTDAQAIDLGMSLEELRNRCELIQLTDLLTSALGGALALSANNEGKQHLCELVSKYHSDTFDYDWSEALVRARRFSISCFPGPGGIPYAVSLRGIRKFGIAHLRSNREIADQMRPLDGFSWDAVGKRAL